MPAPEPITQPFDSSGEQADEPRPSTPGIGLFFSDIFAVKREVLADYGAFDLSLVNDLPLFIDPFLLFHSTKPEYKALHVQMIDYLCFLRERSTRRSASDDELKLWYCFPEVRQNWLGFSLSGNRGSGLGLAFARQFHEGLNDILGDFGREKVTAGSHIEKIALVRDGIGRDNISDLVANLILGYLCEYTETFAIRHLDPSRLARSWITRAAFNYDTETWEQRSYRLPVHKGEHVILTPRDLLTRDTTWINRRDMIERFDDLPPTIADAQLRAAVNNYFYETLALIKPHGKASGTEAREQAIRDTFRHFPALVDYYIRLKEDQGDAAHHLSADNVLATELIFSQQIREHVLPVFAASDLFRRAGSTYTETHARLAFLKEAIEEKGVWRIFYPGGQLLQRETDIQLLFKLVWYGTRLDPSSEVNDGRGPADFKISRGREKTIVEFKLAKSRSLEANLMHQAEIYRRSSGAQTAIYAIVFYTEDQQRRVQDIIAKLQLANVRDIVLIDARHDNKPAASKT